jgi:hypothetical protein
VACNAVDTDNAAAQAAKVAAMNNNQRSGVTRLGPEKVVLPNAIQREPAECIAPQVE